MQTKQHIFTTQKTHSGKLCVFRLVWNESSTSPAYVCWGSCYNFACHSLNLQNVPVLGDALQSFLGLLTEVHHPRTQIRQCVLFKGAATMISMEESDLFLALKEMKGAQIYRVALLFGMAVCNFCLKLATSLVKKQQWTT